MNSKIQKTSTKMLENVLLNAKWSDVDDIFEKNKDIMVKPKVVFYNFIKDKLLEKKINQKELFLNADIPNMAIK